MTGEGIECVWAMSKLHCRKSPMALKRGKENFRNITCLSMSTENVLALERCRKFSNRARRCIVNHIILDNESNVPAGKKTSNKTTLCASHFKMVACAVLSV